MGKNQSASNLINIINYNNGNILFVSGSTTLMTISSSGAIITTGVISGSNILTSSYSQNSELLDNLDSTSFVFTSSYNPTSASFSTRVTNNESTASVLTTASASFAVVSSSYSSASGSLSTRVTTLEAASASLNTASGSFSTRVTTIESKYATTGSNTFTGPQYVSHASNAIGFTSTASLYTDGGFRVTKDAFVSGTLYLNNLTVYGTSSIQYVTSSQLNVATNIITVNTNTPAIRFGGLTVFDSGSLAGTGSLFWDSQNDKWIYSNPSGSTYDGGMLISGPRNTTGLGNEVGTTACALMMGQGGDHITSSAIFHYGNATCFYGNALVVSGSGNIGIDNSSPASFLYVGTYASAGKYIDSSTLPNTPSNYLVTLTPPSTTNYYGGGIGWSEGTNIAAGINVFDDGATGALGLSISTGTNSCLAEKLRITSTGAACFACELTAKSLGTNDLILNNLNHEHANYVDGTRGSWLIQEGACDLFIINQVSCKKYKFNLIEIK